MAKSRINAKEFNFSLFLSDKKEVENLEEAANQYGGSTENHWTGEKYSNFQKSDYIEVNPNKNSIGIMIPSTVNIFQKASQNLIQNVLLKVSGKINQRYHETANVEHCEGYWISSQNELVQEDIIQLTVFPEKVNKSDINFFVELAKYVKDTMKQESVVFNVNNSLCLI